MAPSPDYVVASGSLPPGVPPDFYARVARIGKEKGTKTIVDVPGKALKEALEEEVFLIKPNVRPGAGRRGDQGGIADQGRGSKVVKNGRCEVLVISLGAAGALAVSKDFAEHILPPTVPIISKVGAGDSMVAGITLRLARSKPLRESVLFGVAAGTAAVMTPGTELSRREDTERLYGGIISGHQLPRRRCTRRYMVVSAAKAALSMLPILTILIIMLVLLRWSAARAGVIGLIVTILVAWLGFGYGSDVYPDLGITAALGGVFAEAVFTAGTILDGSVKNRNLRIWTL